MADGVLMRLELSGVDDNILRVRTATIQEELNAVGSAVMEIHCGGPLPEMHELLYRDCALHIESNAQSRLFRGVVQHAEVHGAGEGAILNLRVAPAMACLEHVVDTRIYQEMPVLDVIQDIFGEHLRGRSLQVRNESGSHDVHEYLVQYNESCLAFVQRLLERDRILYYFDHEGDHEALVLADSTSSCPALRGSEEIPFAAAADPRRGAITSVHHARRIGSSSTKMAGTVVAAQPGRTFTLSGAPEASFDGRYLILQNRTVAVAPEGANGSLTQDMEVSPADRPYVPPSRAPVPILHGMELATVVDPGGTEVHTDEHGRIKVQFHWNRHGRNDQRSSCWIRLAQMWGGVLWGTHFTPRVGMEVIISFLGGHPDRPVVIGSLYDGSHRPPHAPRDGRGAEAPQRAEVRTSGARLLLDGDDAKVLATGNITLESGPCRIEVGGGQVAISAPAVKINGSELALDASGAAVAGTATTRLPSTAMAANAAGIAPVS